MRFRTLQSIAAGAAGLGIGLLAYRFVLLGVSASNAVRVVLLAGGAGLIVPAIALHVTDPNCERPWESSHVALAIVGLVVAIGALLRIEPMLATSLERRQLPGFSISLPAVAPTVQRIDYSSGEIRFATVAVLWGRRQSADTLDLWLRELVHDRVSPYDIAMKGRDDDMVQTMGVDTDPPVRMSRLRCASRDVFVTSFGEQTEPLHRRMLRSFACTPDPAFENRVEEVRVAVDLPTWTATERTSRARHLTNGSALLYLFEGPPRDWTMSELASALPGLLNDRTVVAGEPIVDRVPFTRNIDGTRDVGWIRSIRCATHNVMLAAEAASEAEAKALYVLTMAARCLRDGEVPPDWASTPSP